MFNMNHNIIMTNVFYDLQRPIAFAAGALGMLEWLEDNRADRGLPIGLHVPNLSLGFWSKMEGSSTLAVRC